MIHIRTQSPVVASVAVVVADTHNYLTPAQVSSLRLVPLLLTMIHRFLLE